MERDKDKSNNMKRNKSRVRYWYKKNEKDINIDNIVNVDNIEIDRDRQKIEEIEKQMDSEQNREKQQTNKIENKNKQ